MPVSILAVLFLITFSIVFLFPASPSPNVDSMNYTSAVLGGVFLTSTGWYYFPKVGGKCWFEGPRRNVDEVLDEDKVSEGNSDVVKDVGGVKIEEVDVETKN